MHCTARNGWSYVKQFPSRGDNLFLLGIFRWYPVKFEDNSARIFLFLCAGSSWDSRLSLRERNQNFNFGGTIGYGDTHLEFVFRHFKVLRLQAILHDAAAAVSAHKGKGPGYWYTIEPGWNPYPLDHVTRKRFCFYVKLFLPSTSNSVDSWSSVSRNVLDFKLADGNVLKELGDFFDENLQEYSFCPPEKYKPTKKQFGKQEFCTKLCETVDVLLTVSFPTIFLKL